MYYDETEARQLVIEAGHRLLEKKLIARTWGNISARIGADRFVITPSGRGYDTLRPEELVAVDIADCAWEGDIKPSSEKGVHAAAYGLRSRANFIIHTHQYYASVLAAGCRSVEFAPCAEYALPGTDKLRSYVETSILDNPLCDRFLMARHGALIIAEDMDGAFAAAEELEEESRRLVEKKVPGQDAFPEEALDLMQVRSADMPCVVIARDRYIMECCQAGVRIGPYIDDFAQIAGPDISVTDNEPRAIRRALIGRDRPGRGLVPVLDSMTGRNAVLVRGVGAVCAGKTQDDAEAVAMIVSKNCAAACYVRNGKPLSPADARLQRFIYLTKYSRLKGGR